MSEREATTTNLPAGHDPAMARAVAGYDRVPATFDDLSAFVLALGGSYTLHGDAEGSGGENRIELVLPVDDLPYLIEAWGRTPAEALLAALTLAATGKRDRARIVSDAWM